MPQLKRCLALAAVLIPLTAAAMKLDMVEQVCPIGGEKFIAEMAMSGTSMGSYLDTRPYGPTPAPWPLAKCPGNGFVLFKDKFSDEELDKLKPVVLSDEYQSLKATETHYFLAARLMAVLGAEERRIAYALVQASWEARDETLAQGYRAQALARYAASLAKRDPGTEFWQLDQMIAGELERRLGRFAEAKARFNVLLADERFVNPTYRRIAEHQLTLIAHTDSRNHRVPDAGK